MSPSTSPVDSDPPSYALLSGLAAALGGLLLGYDTAVISGAVGFLRTHFSLDAAGVGGVTSAAVMGAIVGVAGAGVLADRWGRKRTLLLSAVLFLGGVLGAALSGSAPTFLAGRVLTGVGVGIVSMTAPMYVAEVAPARLRGRMVSVYQLAIVVGIQAAYLMNYAIATSGAAAWNASVGWRWMLGAEVLPVAIFLIGLVFVPETPRWLAAAGRRDAAHRLLRRLVGPEHAAARLTEIERTLGRDDGSFRHLLRPGFRPLMAVGVLLPVLAQGSGINAVIYYAPELFEAMGAGTDAAFFRTVAVGTVNLLFTFVAIATVDRLGRRPLLIAGATGMGLCHLGIGAAFFSGAAGGWTLLPVLAFIACFAATVGPVSWVVLSELFPTRVRGRAMSVATLALRVANLAVAQTFPMMMESAWLNRRFGGAFPFWLFALSCVGIVAVAWGLLPETKGRSLEEIEQQWDLDLPTT